VLFVCPTNKLANNYKEHGCTINKFFGVGLTEGTRMAKFDDTGYDANIRRDFVLLRKEPREDRAVLREQPRQHCRSYRGHGPTRVHRLRHKSERPRRILQKVRGYGLP
ncbi:MAG: hypothetical protein ACKPKO_03985, partial [Candidatus Fonsibacter sp.]